MAAGCVAGGPDQSGHPRYRRRTEQIRGDCNHCRPQWAPVGSGYSGAGRRTPMTCRSRVVLTVFLALNSLFAIPNPAFAQETKRDPIEEKDRDHPEQRAKWMSRGRTAPAGQSAAALRLRAHQQKIAMRAKHLASVPVFTSNTAGWVPLGPAPFVSDQNYFGMVSGRATAIAIDPSDATGNTVYAAGAYAGVWKSTNATSIPATKTSHGSFVKQMKVNERKKRR